MHILPRRATASLNYTSLSYTCVAVVFLDGEEQRKDLRLVSLDNL